MIYNYKLIGLVICFVVSIVTLVIAVKNASTASKTLSRTSALIEKVRKDASSEKYTQPSGAVKPTQPSGEHKEHKNVPGWGARPRC
jgi:hypothetical protein